MFAVSVMYGSTEGTCCWCRLTVDKMSVAPSPILIRTTYGACERVNKARCAACIRSTANTHMHIEASTCAQYTLMVQLSLCQLYAANRHLRDFSSVCQTNNNNQKYSADNTRTHHHERLFLIIYKYRFCQLKIQKVFICHFSRVFRTRVPSEHT